MKKISQGDCDVLPTVGKYHEKFDSLQKAVEIFDKCRQDIHATDWQVNAQCLDYLQRQQNGLAILQQITKVYPELLYPSTTAFRELLTQIVVCVSSLRSGVSREAVQTITSIVHTLLDKQKWNTLLSVPVMVLKSVDDKKFLSDSASNCLLEISKIPSFDFQITFINQLSRFVSDTNGRVVANSAQLVACSLETLFGTITRDFLHAVLFPLVTHMLVDKLPKSKQAARQILSIVATNVNMNNQTDSSNELSTCISQSSTTTSQSSTDIVNQLTESQQRCLSKLIEEFLKQNCDMPTTKRLALEKFITSQRTKSLLRVTPLVKRNLTHKPPVIKSPLSAPEGFHVSKNNFPGSEASAFTRNSTERVRTASYDMSLNRRQTKLNYYPH